LKNPKELKETRRIEKIGGELGKLEEGLEESERTEGN
jgi:hypothetical protein